MSVSVSIIVPCYNVAAYLDQCMESLAGQSMEDIEIICVNDGSSDHTAEILREWRDRDGRVRVIDRKNSGVSAARNSGMEAAAGKYIGFVDPDDVVERNMFRRLFDAVDCCSAAPDPSRPFVPLPEGTPRFRLLRAGSPPGGFPHGFDGHGISGAFLGGAGAP